MDIPQDKQQEMDSDLQRRLEGLNLDSDKPSTDLNVLKRVARENPSSGKELPGYPLPNARLITK
jgi:hypothetical protein